MDINDFERDKQKLEVEIASLINNLSQNSGLLISDIYVTSYPVQEMGKEKPTAYQYSVKLKVVI
jgi:hypothetical protein